MMTVSKGALVCAALCLGGIGCNELSGLSALDEVVCLGDACGPGAPLAQPFGLTTGRHGSCVISEADGLARCWGSLPGNGTTGSPSPVVVASIKPKSVAHGFSHMCALDDTGQVWCWGNNDCGQLGDGTNVATLVPQLVPDLSDVTKLSVGAYHSCVKTETSHYCWGNNAYGQLGTGDTVDRNVPTVIPLPATTHFGTGAYHGCTVLETPEVMCWGRNDEGQLGIDPATTPMALSPEIVPGLPELERVYPGVRTTCGRTTNTRQLHCWGNNDFGQLGDGTTTSSLTPVHIPEIERLGVLYPGLRHTCATDTTDETKIKAYCWGANDHGQLGLPSDTAMFPSPQLVVESVGSSMGGKTSEHVCYVDVGGAVLCAGLNDTGQLGDGTTESRDAFEPVWF
jgi:alpha-tubulin suppressor-like RCC1 family protein